MFPQSGTGMVTIDPICPGADRAVPSHLYPVDEANAKYHLFNALRGYGECYCEVSLAGPEQIDLVWLEPDGQGGYKRIIGIEIKTESEFDRATHELVSQVERYRERTFADITDTNFIADDEVKTADEVCLFDQVWVVVVGSHDRWTIPWRDETPEDGWLKYNKFTGVIEYDIDPSSERETIHLDYEQQVAEAHLTAHLWSRYQSPQTLVAAESWFSKPEDRRLKDGQVKYRAGKGQVGKTKQADLVVGKLDDLIPLTQDSTIRGLEVKTSFDASIQSRLQEQLPLYRDSKMFSEVYLVVPSEVSHEAYEFLESEYAKVGLLTIDLEEQKISEQRQADDLDLKKIPMERGSCETQYFELHK